MKTSDIRDTVDVTGASVPTGIRKGSRLVVFGTALFVGGIVAGAGMSYAIADGAGPMGAMHGRMDDPAAMTKHIDRFIKHEIPDATPDQKAKLEAIGQTMFTDMHALGDIHKKFHEQTVAELSAPVIDRAALEQTRVQQLQAADEASKRLVADMASAAEVLTPAQRAKVAEDMKKHEHGGMHGPHGPHGDNGSDGDHGPAH